MDLSKMTARELLDPQGDDYDRAVRQWEERFQAAIARDERLTLKLESIAEIVKRNYFNDAIQREIATIIGDTP